MEIFNHSSCGGSSFSFLSAQIYNTWQQEYPSLAGSNYPTKPINKP